MDYDSEAVVIYNNPSATQAGFAGDEHPRATFGNATESGSTPISSDGTITDWEAMAQFWRETCLEQLRISPETQPILLTGTLKMSQEDREAVIKIFFEELDVNAFFLANPGVMSLYASGRVTGVAVIVDEAETVVIPVNEGYAVKDAIQENVSSDEIAEAVSNSIAASDIDIRGELYSSIIVSGSNSEMQTIADKLKTTLKDSAPPQQKIKVVVPTEAETLAWMGGSIIASQSSFKSSWITRAMYDEHGAGVVHEKCP